jgi:hypothetical protein
LESENGTAEAGERIGGTNVFVGVGISRGAGSGKVAEEFAQANGGELEATFRELDRVSPLKQSGEGFVPGAHFVAPELIIEPVLVTAVLPVGEIVFGKDARERRSVRGLELFEDHMIRNAILDQLIDLVANRRGEAGDFTPATTAGDGRMGAGLGTVRRAVDQRDGNRIGCDEGVLSRVVHKFGARKC